MRREIDHGRQNIYQIHKLHLVRWASVVDAAVLEKVKPVVLDMLLTRQGGSLLEHPQIRRIVDIFGIHRPLQEARLIYIVTRPLAETNSRLENVSFKRPKKLTSAATCQSYGQLVLAGFKHWSLLVIGKDGRWKLFEMVRDGNVMKLRQLCNGEIRMTKKWRLFPVGYTFLNDDHIMELGKSGTSSPLL